MLQNDNEQKRNLKRQPLTVIELFSGIGAQKRGIDLTGLFDCNVIATADVEKDAMVSYAAIHNGLTDEVIDTYTDYPSEDEMKKELMCKNIGYDFQKNTNPLIKMKGRKLKKYYMAMKLSNNLGDITKIYKLPQADLWTYSFPCQDISIAGNQKGIIKGKTRSGLLYEVERLLKVSKQESTLPKYLLLENVKNLVGKQFKTRFDEWVTWLNELGYNTYWEVINAKNCGVPQNRERVFALSIRKDVDTNSFTFAKPFDLGVRLLDFIDNEVDEQFYITNEKVQKFLATIDIDTIVANYISREDNTNNVMQIGNIIENHGNWDNPQRGRIYNSNGISPALNTCGGGGLEPKIMCSVHNDGVDSNKPKFIGNLYGTQFGTGYTGGVRDKKYISPTLTTMQGGGRQPHIICSINPEKDGTCRTIKAQYGKTSLANYHRTGSMGATGITNGVGVRKLTPKECFRLMGFADLDYDHVVSLGMSYSACYRQTGNSIVTYCISGIMEHLYKAQYDNTYICFDENFTQPQVE